MKRLGEVDLRAVLKMAGMTAVVVALGAAAAGCRPEPAETSASTRSFRYSVTWEIRDYWVPVTFVQEGDVVLPGAEHVRTHLVLGALETSSELVRHDGRTWVRGDLPFIDAGMGPLGWLGGNPDAGAGLREALAGLAFVSEEVDGQAARRYELDADTFAAIVSSAVAVPDAFGPPAATLWISEVHGFPVKLSAEVMLAGSPATFAFEMRVYDIDEPGITVDTPKPGIVTVALAGGEAAPTADAPADEPASGGESGPIDTLVHFISGLIGALSGGFEPDGVYIAADAAAEAAPGIAENIENVEEWREANPDDPTVGRAFREPDSAPEEKNWLYNWFWGFIE